VHSRTNETYVYGTNSYKRDPRMCRRDIHIDHTDISNLKWFEQIELPAKLLKYFLWSTKSNISQSRKKQYRNQHSITLCNAIDRAQVWETQKWKETHMCTKETCTCANRPTKDVYVYIWTYICMHVYVYKCVCMYIYVCVHVYVCICLYVYIHV